MKENSPFLYGESLCLVVSEFSGEETHKRGKKLEEGTGILGKNTELKNCGEKIVEEGYKEASFGRKS